MKKLLATLTVFAVMLSALSAQAEPRAYALYNRKGKPTKYRKLLREALKADVVFFGETHNDPIGHWLQNELARKLYAYGPLTLGLEMLEADQQTALDAYLAGTGTEEAIDEVGEGLWGNWSTDYKPLVDWAKANAVPVVATNVPRRYARRVFQEGLASLADLPAAEQPYVAPHPVPYDATLPGYVRMLEMTPGGHGGETFPQAQAIKDATMAHFIARATQQTPGRRVLHLNGSYHSDDFEGIVWYLRQYAPQLRVMTITTVAEQDVRKLSEENMGKANFTIAVPELMTRTY